MLSELSVVVETLQELQRMHQLNLELMEQLDVVFRWIINNDLDIPNKEKIVSLLNKTKALTKELYSTNTTKTLHYHKLADEKKQHFRTDEEVPEPVESIYNGV